MICDMKFATVSQSENITIGPRKNKGRFLGKQIRNDKKF